MGQGWGQERGGDPVPPPPDPNSFDTPEDVAASFLASLAQTVEVAEANDTRGGGHGGLWGG